MGFAHEKKRLGHSLVWGLIDRFRGRSPRYGLEVGFRFNLNRHGVASRLSVTHSAVLLKKVV